MVELIAPQKMELLHYAVSFTGASHLEADRPCQDRSAARDVAGGVLLAVADGHGHKLHPRSALGAQFAVEVAQELLPDFVARLKPLLPPESNSGSAGIEARADDTVDSAFRGFFTDLTRAWLIKVLAHYRAIAPDQPILAPPAILYGTTLLAAMAVEGLWVAFGVGDGMIGYLTKTGEAVEPVPDDKRCHDNFTTSLCSAAPDDFRYAWGRNVPPTFILSTDGLANSFGDDKELLSIFLGGVVGNTTSEGFEQACRGIDEALPQISADFSRDDMSVALWIDPRHIDALSPIITQANNDETHRIISDMRSQLDDCRLSISSLMDRMEQLEAYDGDDFDAQRMRYDSALATLERQKADLLDRISDLEGDITNITI